MSIRTLFEFNHDLSHKIEAERTVFTELLGRYMRSGSAEDAEDLERFGLRFMGSRHHSSGFAVDYGGQKTEEKTTP